MPFTRIALPAGTSAEFQQRLSTILQQTLVAEFDVPEDDCFQLLDEHAPAQRVFDRHYLGGPRSASFIWFSITAGRPRSTLQKQRFYQRLAERLCDELAVRPQDVMVTLTFTRPEDGSFANGEMFNGVPEAT